MTETGEKITGLVGALLAGAGRVGRSENCTLVFYFCAWRTQDGRLLQGKQRCEWQGLDEAQAAAWMQRITSWQQLELVVAGRTTTGALLVQQIGFPEQPDDDLTRLGEIWQQPVVLETALFGGLELDRGLDMYDGVADWGGTEISLSLSCEDAAMPESALATATALFEQQAHWQRQIVACAVEKLLPLKNENWLAEDQSPLTEEAFRGHLEVQSIVAEDEGAFTVYFDDGDLFWGHAIVVRGSLAQGATDADIAG